MTHLIHSPPLPHPPRCVFPSCCFSGLRPAGPVDTLGRGVPPGVRPSRPAPLRPSVRRGQPRLPRTLQSRRSWSGCRAGPSLPAGFCAQDQAPVPLKGERRAADHATADTVEARRTGVKRLSDVVMGMHVSAPWMEASGL